MKNIWVVIPAHNEGRRILGVLRNVRKYAANIVVVDDGSTDDTNLKALDGGAIILTHIINLGKGAALKTGCDYAASKGARLIVVMDADGQHDPAEIPNFVKMLEKADICLGFRRLNMKMPFVFRLGNASINLVTYLLYRIRLHDTQCGFRAFSREAYAKIRWSARDYSVESEMIANMGKSHLKYVEVPISTIYADRYKGTNVLDGIKIVLNMILWRLRR